MKKIILLFALFKGCIAFGQTDTIPAILLMSDTSGHPFITTDYHTLEKACDECLVAYKQNVSYIKDNATYWIKGYEVRRLRNFNDNAITFDDYPQTPTKYIHIDYLDEDKKPFPDYIIVWQSK